MALLALISSFKSTPIVAVVDATFAASLSSLKPVSRFALVST